VELPEVKWTLDNYLLETRLSRAGLVSLEREHTVGA
jgi:hypothetical protein